MSVWWSEFTGLRPRVAPSRTHPPSPRGLELQARADFLTELAARGALPLPSRIAEGILRGTRPPVGLETMARTTPLYQAFPPPWAHHPWTHETLPHADFGLTIWRWTTWPSIHYTGRWPLELLKQYLTALWPTWSWDSFAAYMSFGPLVVSAEDPIQDIARATPEFTYPLTGETLSPTVIQRFCRELIARIRDFGPPPGAHTEAIQWKGYHAPWSSRVQSRWWETILRLAAGGYST